VNFDLFDVDRHRSTAGPWRLLAVFLFLVLFLGAVG